RKRRMLRLQQQFVIAKTPEAGRAILRRERLQHQEQKIPVRKMIADELLIRRFDQRFPRSEAAKESDNRQRAAALPLRQQLAQPRAIGLAQRVRGPVAMLARRLFKAL